MLFAFVPVRLTKIVLKSMNVLIGELFLYCHTTASQDEARVNSANYNRPYVSIVVAVKYVGFVPVKKLTSSGFSNSVLYLSLHSESRGLLKLNYYGICKK